MSVAIMVVHIPSVTNDERIGSVFNHLFAVIHQMENGEGDVCWDFSRTRFLHPFFVAALSIYKETSEENISMQNVSASLNNYLQTIRFGNSYDASQLSSEAVLKDYLGKTFIPVSKFDIKGGNVDQAQSILQNVIEEQAKVANSMKMPISYLTSELICNIGEHSDSKYGYLFSQKVRDDLYIVIADNGKTIYNSYVDTGKYIDRIGNNEAMALKLANEGFSTKDRPDAENRGYGISKSREIIVDGLKGAFFILSGNAFFRHDIGGTVAVNVPKEFHWKGTIILIRMPLVAPREFNIYNHLY